VCERFDFEVEAEQMKKGKGREREEKLKPLDLTHQYARWFPPHSLSIETLFFCLSKKANWLWERLVILRSRLENKYFFTYGNNNDIFLFK
jgi:hypothetical protein